MLAISSCFLRNGFSFFISYGFQNNEMLVKKQFTVKSGPTENTKYQLFKLLSESVNHMFHMAYLIILLLLAVLITFRLN